MSSICSVSAVCNGSNRDCCTNASEIIRIHASDSASSPLASTTAVFSTWACPDYATRGYKTVRMLETTIDADTRRVTMYDFTPDGAEFVTMESIYRRRR